MQRYDIACVHVLIAGPGPPVMPIAPMIWTGQILSCCVTLWTSSSSGPSSFRACVYPHCSPADRLAELDLVGHSVYRLEELSQPA